MDLNNSRDVLMAALSQEHRDVHQAGRNDDQDIEMLFAVMT